VFDPACGSGNFLVIAYKEMRAIEAMINQRRGEADAKTAIPKTNFRGIELRDFAAEIARLALIIAEFQCCQRQSKSEPKGSAKCCHFGVSEIAA
jgi:type I restriction-modification system DNA methylase subunit